jgi:hypothetical protein
MTAKDLADLFIKATERVDFYWNFFVVIMGCPRGMVDYAEESAHGANEDPRYCQLPDSRIDERTGAAKAHIPLRRP